MRTSSRRRWSRPGCFIWASGHASILTPSPPSGLAWDENAIPTSSPTPVGPLARSIEQVIVTGRPTLSRPVSALLARTDLRLASHRPSQNGLMQVMRPCRAGAERTMQAGLCGQRRMA